MNEFVLILYCRSNLQKDHPVTLLLTPLLARLLSLMLRNRLLGTLLNLLLVVLLTLMRVRFPAVRRLFLFQTARIYRQLLRQADAPRLRLQFEYPVFDGKR